MRMVPTGRAYLGRATSTSRCPRADVWRLLNLLRGGIAFSCAAPTRGFASHVRNANTRSSSTGRQMPAKANTGWLGTLNQCSRLEPFSPDHSQNSTTELPCSAPKYEPIFRFLLSGFHDIGYRYACLGASLRAKSEPWSVRRDDAR